MSGLLDPLGPRICGLTKVDRIECISALLGRVFTVSTYVGNPVD
jgi:hypothetical protein